MGMLAELFLTTAIMGCFTTFSTFSLDTVSLWMRGDQVATATYVILSIGVSIAALVGGMALVRLGAQVG